MPEHRCRRVEEKTKTDKPEDFFAATPPLDAKKMLFSSSAIMESTARLRTSSMRRERTSMREREVKCTSVYHEKTWSK